MKGSIEKERKIQRGRKGREANRGGREDKGVKMKKARYRYKGERGERRKSEEKKGHLGGGRKEMKIEEKEPLEQKK